MRLTGLTTFTRGPPGNYGDVLSQTQAGLHPVAANMAAIALAWLALTMSAPTPAIPPQANQPSFDPRQNEKHFDDLQSGPAQPAVRPKLRMPQLARAEAAADSKPLFVLRSVSLTGAGAVPHGRLVTTYQPYLGKKVSQADLAAIAGCISDLYRAAGFHLSRAIVPPQDINDGRVRIEVIEGSIAEIALKGDGAEQFGVRPFLDPVLAEHPSRLATLERQLLLINGSPGVRIADS